jgi:hypothetical protein
MGKEAIFNLSERDLWYVIDGHFTVTEADDTSSTEIYATFPRSTESIKIRFSVAYFMTL